MAMDDERFDCITRALAAALSRRGVLRLLAGATTLAGSRVLSQGTAPTRAQGSIEDAQCEAGPVIDHQLPGQHLPQPR
jgi:hypothetical protein